MFDKLLLILLILLLPLGVLVTKYYFSGATTSVSGVNEEKVQELEDLMKKLDEKYTPSGDQAIVDTNAVEPDFQILEVKRASGSGALRISGLAPTANIPLVVTIGEVNPAKTDTLGSTETWLAPVSNKNEFALEYSTSSTKGVLYIRLMQEKNVSSIRYDLALDKRV